MFADRLRNILAHAQRIAKNPVKRRKLRRGSVVALIALGGVLGFDYVITGGPDWNPIGADARQFAFVASAAAAETDVRSFPQMVTPAASLPEPDAVMDTDAELLLVTYDPNVSADDLLGAPVARAQVEEEALDIAALLASLRAPLAEDIAPLVRPAATKAPWLP